MATTTVIERMRKEQEELSIAIRVFERMTEGQRQNGAMRAAATAMALPATNGHKRRSTRKRSWAKPLPRVEAPDGVSLKGVPLADGIKMALQAISKPVDSWHLAALLKAAGMADIKARTVGSLVGRLAKTKNSGIRKTAKGWVAA
jgi:hypothetical protein